jgi:hypothetical protein
MYYISKNVGRMLDIIFFVLALLSQINISVEIQRLRNHIIQQLIQENIEKETNKKIVDIPKHIVTELCCLYTIRKKFPECLICLENVSHKTLTITGCGHILCKNCRTKIDKCPICRHTLEEFIS